MFDIFLNNNPFSSFVCFIILIIAFDIRIHFTVEPRLYGPRLSGLFDYPDVFSGPVFFMNINKL